MVLAESGDDLDSVRVGDDDFVTRGATVDPEINELFPCFAEEGSVYCALFSAEVRLIDFYATS
jgi:hypothetical protein